MLKEAIVFPWNRRHVSGLFARVEYSAMIKTVLDDYYSATCAARYRGGPFPPRWQIQISTWIGGLCVYPGWNAINRVFGIV